MKSCIYEIWIGDYFYQGSTNNLARRMKYHESKLKDNKHQNIKMQRVYNKHQAFEYQVLVECEESLQYIYEQDYIDANFGDIKYLNLNPYASKPPIQRCGFKGKHSEETKAKIATAPRLSATTPTPGVPTDVVRQYIPLGLKVPMTVEVGDCITATATRYCLAVPGLTLSKTTSIENASPARTGEPSG
jgi:hypothetical protein